MAAVGESWCFVLNAISYLFVIAMLMRMDLPRRVATSADRRTTLREGIQYARAPGRSATCCCCSASLADWDSST